MGTEPPGRNVTAVLLRAGAGDVAMLGEALSGLCAGHKLLAPPAGKSFDVQYACRLALTTKPDLVLLSDGDVRLAYGDVSRLLDGYEAGSRIVVGDRRSPAGRMIRPLVGLGLGVWRSDMGSPVRLYDAEALAEVLSHVPPGSRRTTLLMSMVEHRLRFAVREIRLRHAEEASGDTDAAGVLAETLAGLGELWGFRAAARAIR